MDLKTALQRMEELLALMDEYYACQGSKEPFTKTDRITVLYGEIEEVLHQFEGTQVIKVGSAYGQAAPKSRYSSRLGSNWSTALGRRRSGSSVSTVSG